MTLRAETRALVLVVSAALLAAAASAGEPPAKCQAGSAQATEPPRTLSPAEAEERRRKDERENEKAARECIAMFNKELAETKSTYEIAGLVLRHLDVRHSLIRDRLVLLLQGPGDDAIHAASVDALVKIDDPRCVPVLNETLMTRLRRPQETPRTCGALLAAIGHFRSPSSVPVLVKALHLNDNGTTAAACRIAPRIPELAVVEELVKLLHESELPDYGAAGVGGVNSRKDLREPALKALKAATRKAFATAKDWRAWWDENRATYKPGGATAVANK